MSGNKDGKSAFSKIKTRLGGSLPNLFETESNFKHKKLLTLEEEKILSRLDELFEKIDPEKPDEQLNCEESVVRKLKSVYKDDSLTFRPVAPKSTRNNEDLAISKPLLSSVCTNTKLEEIVRDGSSRKFVEIDAAKKRVSFDERRNSLKFFRDYPSFESLENIYKSIDQSVPENELRKEQRFALRMKIALENSKRGGIIGNEQVERTSLRKNSRVEISKPTQESVLKNTKLCKILQEDSIKKIGEAHNETIERKKLNKVRRCLESVNKIRSSRISGSLQDVRTTETEHKRPFSSMENLSEHSTVSHFEIIPKVLPEKHFATTLEISSSSSSSSATEGTDLPELCENNPQNISKPDSNTEPCGTPPNNVTVMRLLSITPSDLDEDEILARYSRLSIHKKDEEIDEEEDFSSQFDEDTLPDEKSLYSISLHSTENQANDETNTLETYETLPENSNEFTDETRETPEEEEITKVAARYKNVVEEIKRKYSSTGPETNENDGKSYIESVRKTHKEDFEDIDKLGYENDPEMFNEERTIDSIFSFITEFLEIERKSLNGAIVKVPKETEERKTTFSSVDQFRILTEFLENERENSQRSDEPVYENVKQTFRENCRQFDATKDAKKPRPLPRRKLKDEEESRNIKRDVVKVTKDEYHLPPPNFSTKMERQQTSTSSQNSDGIFDYFATPPETSTTRTSSEPIRRTKKFIKNSSSSSVERDEFISQETKIQIIPDELIDYVDSAAKVTEANFFEPCSRPQTSRQSAQFRFSYFDETTTNNAIARNSVTKLRDKFEHEIKKQSTAPPKYLNEKATYDLIFKTDSKYWYDNMSEIERIEGDVPIQTASSSSYDKPLNITILDPIESRTNANYRHLFEKDDVLPVVENSQQQLSELNLKTSIPCVDFTIIDEDNCSSLRVVEKESNASLYNFDINTTGSSSRSSHASTTRGNEFSSSTSG